MANQNQMQWLNAISTRPSLEAAVAEVTVEIEKNLSGRPDLGIIFISSAYKSEYPRLVPLILERLSLPILIGCGGGGIVGMTSEEKALETESNPALSLTVACLPGVEVKAFHTLASDLPDLDSSPTAWEEVIGIAADKEPQFILLGEPFFAKMNDFLAGLDFAYPQSQKLGGLASTGMRGNSSGLFFHQEGYLGSHLRSEGMIGVGLSGNIILETIVAQGCRPIGKPLQITKGERNIVLELAELDSSSGRSSLVMLRELMETLSEEDRLLAQSSLFIGIAQTEFKISLEPGDFLIRNLLGVDPKVGAIAIGDRVRPGQRIQMHLRDADTSAEDLEFLLKRYLLEKGQPDQVVGALMFSCLGRGEGLYGEPNFDSGLFHHYFPKVPLGGFFCNGEIGPVGGQTFLHGYTSVFGMIRQRDLAEDGS